MNGKFQPHEVSVKMNSSFLRESGEGKWNVEDKIFRVLRRREDMRPGYGGGSVYLIWEIKQAKAPGRANKPASGGGPWPPSKGTRPW